MYAQDKFKDSKNSNIFVESFKSLNKIIGELNSLNSTLSSVHNNVFLSSKKL